MISLHFVQGESKTGKKGSEYSHWYAVSPDFDGAGETPLDAVMALAQDMERKLQS